jgi:metallo-beta-lactamase family protein
LQEEQAKFLNQHGGSKHQPAKPLYTLAEAKQSLNYFKVVPFAEPVILSDSLQFSFYYAGHILGAGFVRLQHKQTSICFSGDLGRSNDPIMKAPQAPVASDYFVVESTYGNRLHEQVDPERQLAHIINRVAKRNGVIVVPAFAVGRAQAVLYFLHQLKLKKQIPDIPVYLDSPMATDATKIFYQHSEQHRLSEQETVAVCQTTRYVKLQEESKALDQQEGPMIIISASGMATGGRVLHHLRSFASDANNAIVFCGFQAPGTRGDRLVQGERQIKLLGETIPVLAEVHQLQNTSAHADYQGMTEWLAKLKHKPKKVFITHGENAAAEGLKQQLETTLNLSCVIPHYLDKQVLR